MPDPVRKNPGGHFWTKWNTKKFRKLGTQKQVNCNRKIGRIELAESSLKFPLAKYILQPALKDAPQQMHFLGSIKRGAKTHSGEKPLQIRPSPSQNMSQTQYSCIFQEPMIRGRYAYMGLWVKCALGNFSCVSKIPPVPPKKQKITVCVFLSTLQLTALLVKGFRLRLHCYTLLTAVRDSNPLWFAYHLEVPVNDDRPAAANPRT